MILPVLPLLNISIFKEGEIAHDRYLYLPSVGLCVLVVLALSYLGASKMAMPVALLLILAAFFGIATFSQSAMWASDFSLAARGVEVAPNNAMAANNLGKELALRGDYNGAVPLFRKAVERRPRYWLANFNLGYVYYRVGNLPEAETYLRRAIEIFPRDAAEQRFLGYALLELGRNAEAESTLRQAIALKSEAPNQHFALGTILRDRKDLEGALREFRLELTFNPGNQQARQAISDLEGKQGSQVPTRNNE
jgi:Flp pilus assembly protein TadD